MATYTKEQVNRWNGKLQNGFKLDMQSLVFWNEKCPAKHIDLGDGKRLIAKLSYHDIVENYRSTGKKQPTLNLSIWKETGTGMLSSHGLGANIKLGELQDKKNYNELAKLTAGLDTETIMELASAHADVMSDQYLV